MFFVVVAGFVVGLAAFAVLGVLVRQAQSLLDALGRTSDRPGTAMTVALVVCGTLCLFAALWVGWYTLSSSRQVVQSTTNLGNFGGTVVGSAQVDVRGPTPLLLPVLAILTFLLGAAMIGIGICGSFRSGVRPAGIGAVDKARPLPGGPSTSAMSSYSESETSPGTFIVQPPRG